MGNPLWKTTISGTIAEILVQLRLLGYGIQAAPPIKDSGNDLIALKGEIVRFIQVKSSEVDAPQLRDMPEIWHVAALVKIARFENGDVSLDQSKIYVVKKGEDFASRRELTREVANQLWSSEF